jgi:hypothetical protein
MNKGMSVFGPFYPADLQRTVNHAERFARAIARRADPAVWLVGRADEIEVFVADIVADWRARRLTSKRSAAIVDRYLLDLHRGFVVFARDAVPPPCCRPCEVTVDVDVVNLRVAP